MHCQSNLEMPRSKNESTCVALWKHKKTLQGCLQMDLVQELQGMADMNVPFCKAMLRKVSPKMRAHDGAVAPGESFFLSCSYLTWFLILRHPDD